MLLVKMFSLKQKTNEILSAAIEKIKFCLIKKNVISSLRYIFK